MCTLLFFFRNFVSEILFVTQVQKYFEDCLNCSIEARFDLMKLFYISYLFCIYRSEKSHCVCTWNYQIMILIFKRWPVWCITGSCATCSQRVSWTACAIAQSGQELHCPLYSHARMCGYAVRVRATLVAFGIRPFLHDAGQIMWMSRRRLFVCIKQKPISYWIIWYTCAGI